MKDYHTHHPASEEKNKSMQTYGYCIHGNIMKEHNFLQEQLSPEFIIITLAWLPMITSRVSNS